jgi:acylphosphatase
VSGEVARRVVVRGRVQGVFFRDSCRRRARAAGVSGWVRNTPAGEVEAWFEGAGDDVERLVAWCREGPSGASVESVDVAEEGPTGEKGFHIR